MVFWQVVSHRFREKHKPEFLLKSIHYWSTKNFRLFVAKINNRRPKLFVAKIVFNVTTLSLLETL